MSEVGNKQRRSPDAHPVRAARARALPRNIKAIFEAAQDAMALLDENGRIVQANRAFYKLLAPGDSPAQEAANLAEWAWLLRAHATGGHPADGGWPPVAWALRGEGLVGTKAVDFHVRAPDGRELDLRVSAAPLHTKAGRITGCIVVLCDKTEGRRSSVQLKEETDRVAALSREVANRAQEREAIIEAIADGVLLYDTRGRLLHLNASARTLLGLGEERAADETSLVEERLEEYTQHAVEGRALPRNEWPLARVLRGEKVAGREAADAILRLPDGGVHVLNISAAPVYQGQRLAGAVLMLRDVTERRRLEHELAEHASQIEGVFEAMSDGLAFHDAEGRVVRMNPAARRLLGYDVPDSRRATPADDWDDHVPLMDSRSQPLPREQRPLARILCGETLISERAADVRVRRPDGTEVVLGVSGAPVRDSEGHIIGAVLSTRDMTEARRLDAERTQMMSTVSHELKTPLAAISMAEQLIEKRAALGKPPSGDAIDYLADGVTRMARLVNDLVDAARMEVGHLALQIVRHDLRVPCRHATEEQMHATDRSVALNLPRRPVEINGDLLRISQVLTNLLSNALKYSAPDRPVSLRLRRKGGMARVEVRDEGPGVRPEDRPHLFERFYRAPGVQVLHGAGVGLGLGLYIARTVVELHGGQIGVESVLGSGSTFWFALPLIGDTLVSGD